MKKTISFFAVFILILTVSIVAFADEWTVEFLPNGTMGGTLTARSLHDLIGNMEPGDTETFNVRVINKHPQTTRWYMWNIVDKTLEEANKNLTNGGAYSYYLSYQGYDKNGQKSGDSIPLYDSDKVGGESAIAGRQGLHEATANLEDYFFLDTLNSGESGLVTLTVSFDGETQGNVYQNTVADISMRFAVELANNSPPGSSTRTAVRTGDENNLIPYYIGMIVAGLLLLYLALDAVTDRMYKKGKG